MGNSSKKTAFLFATAVCLDFFLTGGSTSTSVIAAKSGLGGVFRSIRNLSKDTGINVFGNSFSKTIDEKLENNLSKVFQDAAEKTLSEVRQKFIEDKELQVKLKDRIIEFLGNGIPSKNVLNQHALDSYFFDPIKEIFHESDSINEFFAGHEQLNPGVWIEKQLDSKNLQFPGFRKEQQPLLRNALIDGFNEQFIIHFISEITHNPKARDEYLTFLLHSVTDQLIQLSEKQDEISEQVIKLLDLAKWHGIEIRQIINQHENVTGKLDDLNKSIQTIRKEFHNSQKLLLDISRHKMKDADTSQQFRYESLYTNFVGRHKELEFFRDFLEDNRQFCWTILCGDGGTGKSRLANEICLRAENVRWISGFSRFNHNKSFSWENFDFQADTLIVFDYFSGRKEEIGKILDVFATRANTNRLSSKIRILLIDRQISNIELEKIFIAQSSLKSLFFLANQDALIPEAYYLTTMEDDALWEIICQMVSGSEHEVDVVSRRDKIIEQLNFQDLQKRPLFAFFTGIALAEGQDVTAWNANDNLRFHLQRQEEKIWKKASIWEKNSRGLKNLIWIATICEYITFDDILNIHEQDEYILGFNPDHLSENELEELKNLFVQVKIEHTNIYIGIKPDLLGEYFITNRIVEINSNEQLKKYWPIIIDTAWKIRPDRAWLMIYLTYQNYVNHMGIDGILTWLNEFSKTSEPDQYLGSLFFSLALLHHGINKKEEISFYEKAVCHNSILAMVNLGVIYKESGELKTAESWWNKAAEVGDANAMVNLGVIYKESGDLKTAKIWYKKAAEAGDANAMVNLGVIYKESGELKSAENWYKKAAVTGDADAMFNLGVLYSESSELQSAMNWWEKAAGAGVAKAMFNLGVMYKESGDLKTAEIWYMKAVEAGHTDAMFNLGVMYEKSGELHSAESWYKKAAKVGHAGAMVNLGVIYRESGELKSAMNWLEKAAKVGHAGAMLNLGLMYKESDELNTAVSWWKKATGAGHTGAMFNLGFMYKESGDLQSAESWYKKAAKMGHEGAMLNLGLIFKESGDLKTAEIWYLKAAKVGLAGAMVNLGVMYEESGDLQSAESWYKRAAKVGHAGAMVKLGVIYKESGELKTAESWWKKAAEAGDANAMVNLGVMYKESGKLQSAESWWKKAAEAGDADAMFNLGVMCKESGELQSAESWYKKAAGAGVDKAMFNLGVMYKESGDLKTTEIWYKKAVEAGHTDAMFNLGVLYEESGVMQSAESWYKKAAKAGHAGAMLNLGLMFKETGELKTAVSWWKKAAGAGNTGAMFNLGFMYEESGELQSAMNWWEKAAKMGHAGAMVNLGIMYKESSELKTAESWYKKAYKMGNFEAKKALIILFWQNKRNMKLAWKYAEEILIENEDEINIQILCLVISAWLGKYSHFNSKLDGTIDHLANEQQTDTLKNLFISLLYHTNSELLLNQFEERKYSQFLQEQLNVYFYLVLHFTIPDDPRLKQVPEEIKEELRELINHVNERREFYSK